MGNLQFYFPVFVTLVHLIFVQSVDIKYPGPNPKDYDRRIPSKPEDPFSSLIYDVDRCVRQNPVFKSQLAIIYNWDEIGRRVYNLPKEFQTKFMHYADEMNEDVIGPYLALLQTLNEWIEDYMQKAGLSDGHPWYPIITTERVHFVYFMSSELPSHANQPLVRKYIEHFVGVMKDRERLAKIGNEAIQESKTDKISVMHASIGGSSGHTTPGQSSIAGRNVLAPADTMTHLISGQGSSKSSSTSDLNEDSVSTKYGLKNYLVSEIAMESFPVDDEIINQFIRKANKQFAQTKMIELVHFRAAANALFHSQPISAASLEFLTPRPADEDDIQLMFGGEWAETGLNHLVCTLYNRKEKTVHIYDSDRGAFVGEIQKKIIRMLYPDMHGEAILEKIPHVIAQDDLQSSAFHAMAYATSLFNKKAPFSAHYKLNDVVGDEALYFRLHLLKIFASGKITPFPENK